MVRTWLRECCRQIEAEVVSNSREKFHQTTCKAFVGARYNDKITCRISSLCAAFMSAGVTFLPLAAMYIRGQWLYTAHSEKNLSGVFKKRA